MKPVALPVRVDNIPAALRCQHRWVIWRYEWDGKRWTKRPYQVSGVLAKSDDPSTWNTFEAVLAAYRTGRFDGIGFVLGDGWGGVDFDHVTDHLDVAEPYLIRMPGYVEPSPSGDGYKAFGRSARIGGQIDFAKTPAAKMFTGWARARFFTVTGRGVGDAAGITPILDEWFPLAPALNLSSTREGYTLAAEMSDEDLLCQAFGGDVNSEQILSLWRGETAAYGHDHSRADLALCCHLAWWTNFDAARIDRLFRQSGLYRPKWDHTSYRRATLTKALSGGYAADAVLSGLGGVRGL